MSPRILFYIQRNLHLPFLEPIHEQVIRLCPGVVTAFCAPAYIPPQNGLPGWGLEEHEAQRLSVKTRFVRTVEEFQPDITVFADACTNVYNCGKRVFVGHGIISKGGFYTDNELVRRENIADLICVPGPWHKQILEKNVFSPIEVTGFIKSDRLFGITACTRETFCRQYAIPADATIILYAPTFNDELSAIPCLGEQIVQVCEPDRYLVIKLHTMTDIRIVELHRQLASVHARIRFVEDVDVTPAMAAADILISDVSSVLVEFMALNRPVIAVNNPRQQEYEGYQADDIEYQVRDACLQITNIDELLCAVERVIRQPEELSLQRMRYAEALCFGRDGRAAERAAQAILRLEAGLPTGNVSNYDHFCLLLCVGERDSLATVLYVLGNLVMADPGMQFDVVVWGMEQPQNVDSPLVKAWLSVATPLPEALAAAVPCSTAPWLVMLETGIQLPQRALRFLSNYFRWEPTLTMVRTLTVRDDYRHLLQVVYPELGEIPVDLVSGLLLSTLMGRSVAMEYAAPGCSMIRRADLSLLSNLLPGTGIPYPEQIRRQFAASGRSCKLALDLFATPTTPLAMDTAELGRLVDDFRSSPGDICLLNRLLTVLLSLGCHDDARLVWQQSAHYVCHKLPLMAGVWGSTGG
jgi:hypothetical protein